MMGSLTGVVASQRVTEAFKGSLKTNRNRWLSVNAKGSLTARRTCRADTKVGVSDPVVPPLPLALISVINLSIQKQ